MGGQFSFIERLILFSFCFLTALSMTRVNSLYRPKFRGEYHIFQQLNLPALVLKVHENQNDESRILQVYMES